MIIFERTNFPLFFFSTDVYFFIFFSETISDNEDLKSDISMWVTMEMSRRVCVTVYDASASFQH